MNKLNKKARKKVTNSSKRTYKNPISNIKEKSALIYSVNIPNHLYVVLKRDPRSQLGGTAIMVDNKFKGYIQKTDFDYELYVKYTGDINHIERLLNLDDKIYLYDDNLIGFVTGPKFYSSTKTPLINKLIQKKLTT